MKDFMRKASIYFVIPVSLMVIAVGLYNELTTKNDFIILAVKVHYYALVTFTLVYVFLRRDLFVHLYRNLRKAGK